MPKPSQKFRRVMVYGTLGTGCFLGLVAALAIQDALNNAEAQIAAVYLAILVGSNKAFNAKPLCGSQSLGSAAAFVGTGLLPATIIHVALAEIEPGRSDHLGILLGHAIVLGFGFVVTLMASQPAMWLWRKCEDRANRCDKPPSS